MREKNRSTMGWVIGILAVIGVVWIIAEAFDNDTATELTDVAPTAEYDQAADYDETTATSGVVLDDDNAAVMEEEDLGEASVDPGVLQINEESELTSNTEAYVGKKVQVDGEVNEHIGGAFTVDIDGIIGGDEVLVIPNEANAVLPETGTLATAVGTVRMLNAESVDDEFGFAIDSNWFNEYDQRAVVVADSVTSR